MSRFEDLIAIVLTTVDGATVGSERITFTGAEPKKGNNPHNIPRERTWVMLHHNNCCEHVAVEEVIGDIADIIGSPIVMAEEVSNYEGPSPGPVESHTWTFYKLATAKGYVTLRWLGTSNGYYSESVSFEEQT